jgi:polysaccharide pyruvyl transferase WcaK-like protein
MARDPGSMASLREIGVHARIYPDIAFEMPATSWNERPLAKEVSTFLEADLPWVGLSLSTKVLEEEGDSRRYEDLIAEFAQKLLDRGERILLLPHTYVEGAATKDDTKFSRGVFGRLHPKKAEDLALIDQDLSPGQLKAIIARAELFVGSRYHALLAALSMGVPSVAIGWNYKYDGLFSLFQHEKYAIPLENLSLSLISDLFEDLRTNQNEIRQRIQKRLPEVLKKVHESVGYSLKEIQRISSEN